MAKIKNHKRVSVDQIQKKRQKQNTHKPPNPFEVHINREKMRILGKKQKNEKGLPGISRAKSIQKRKHTLLNEYKSQHKSNKFMDKRIGEKSELTYEDKAMARFAAVRVKVHRKKSIFNLADDEILTHKGQTLSEIEQFDDPRSETEDSGEENNSGKLESSFVKDAHFGGGLFKNTAQEGFKTHKQLIEQLIEESKKRKAEKQKVKEATLELTEKLDSEWKDLVQLIDKNKKDDAKDAQKPKLDDYDRIMRELKFEVKGTVSDRIKSEDEIAMEEKEKLEKLEEDRLERMRCFTETNVPKNTHRSADDLDDNFVIESDTEENMLSYDQEGQANMQIEAQLNGKSLGNTYEDIVEEDTGSNSESECEDGKEENDEDESDSEDSMADLKENNQSSEEHSDVAEEEEEENIVKEVADKPTLKRKIDSHGEADFSNLTDAQKKELEKAGNKLPFTFALPDSYENLMQNLSGESIMHQKVILERIIKCNHPSLSQGNKEGLGFLFAYILQYLNDLFCDVNNPKELEESFQSFTSIMPQIFELSQLNKEQTHRSIVEVIKEKHQEYRNKKKKYPGLEVLAFLKLVSLLFSTSDFRHQIATPCFVFMEQMLRYSQVKSVADISYGLFVCTLALEYTSLSNRYFPSAINFLSGILHMAIPKTKVRIIKVLPPFKSLSSDLVLLKDCSDLSLSSKIHISHLVGKESEDKFKVIALYTALKLLKEFLVTWKSLPSSVEVFEGVEDFLHQIPMDYYPENLKSSHRELCGSLEKLKGEKKLQHLIMEQKKPKALRLYEPKIVEIYEGKRHKIQSKEKAERDKLLHKLKKETKGALREIRRDRSFLGRVKINERIQSDRDRRDKVNKIMAEAALQQSELNAADRKKKRKQ